VANEKEIIRLQNIPTGEYDSPLTPTVATLSNSEFSLGNLEKGSIIDNNFVIEERLNFKGGESVHYLCRKEGEDFVLKIYQNYNLSSEEVIKRLFGKTNPHVLFPVAYGFIEGQFYEINPFIKKGTLVDYSEIINQNFIIRTVIPQVNEALAFFHDLGIIHNDIKPSNLYLSNDGKHILVGDFGSALAIDNHKTYSFRREITTQKRYTAGFAAPERIYGGIAMFTSDYYSFGMTILNLIDPEYFKGLNEDDTNHDQFIGAGIKIKNVGIRGEVIQEPLKDLIYKLTLDDRKKRIGYDGVKKWILKPHYYANAYRNHADLDRFPIPETEFAGEVFNDLKKLLKNLIISPSIVERFNAKYDLIDLFKESNAKVFEENETYLKPFFTDKNALITLCHLIISPAKEFTIFEHTFSNLEVLFEFMRLHYSKLRLSNLDFYQIILLIKQNNPTAYFLNLIESCIALSSPGHRLDAILSIFLQDPNRIKIYFNGAVYYSLDSFFKKQFGPNLDVIVMDSTLFELLLLILGNLFDDINKQKKKILMNPDHTSRMYFLSQLCCGKIYLRYNNHDLSTFERMIHWLGHYVIGNQASESISKRIVQFFFEPIFFEYLDIHKPTDTTKMKSMISMLKIKKDISYSRAYIWFAFNKHAPVYFEGKSFKDYQNLIDYLASTDVKAGSDAFLSRLKKMEASAEIRAFKAIKGYNELTE